MTKFTESSTTFLVTLLMFMPSYAIGERAIPDDLFIVDQYGERVFVIKTGQMIQIQRVVASVWQEEKPFVYLVKIVDEDGFTMQLSWISGNLLPTQTLNVSQSWIPERPGMFEVQLFVWDKLVNPVPLSHVSTGAVEVQLDTQSVVKDSKLVMLLDNHKGDFTDVGINCTNCYSTGMISVHGNRTFNIGFSFNTHDTKIQPVVAEIILHGSAKPISEFNSVMIIDKFTVPAEGTSISESIIKNYKVSSPYIAISISYLTIHYEDGTLGGIVDMSDVKTTLWIYTIPNV